MTIALITRVLNDNMLDQVKHSSFVNVLVAIKWIFCTFLVHVQVQPFIINPYRVYIRLIFCIAVV